MMHSYRQGEHRCTASWLSGRLLSSQSERPQCQGCAPTDRNVPLLSLECRILQRAPVAKQTIHKMQKQPNFFSKTVTCKLTPT